MNLADLAKKLNEHSDCPDTLKDFALLLEKKNDNESSRMVLSYLCKIDPSIENIILYCESLIVSKEKDNVLKAVQLLNDILDNIKDLDRIKSFEVRKLLGNAYTTIGDARSAAVFYENCLKIDSSNDLIYSNIGILLFNNDLYEEALEYFNTAIEINPENTSALTVSAMIHEKYGKLRRAFLLLDIALKFEPSNLVALNLYIDICNRIEKLDLAEEKLENYLKCDALNIGIIYTYAVVLVQLGKIDLAKFELHKILILDPAHSYANELMNAITESEQDKERIRIAV